MQKIKNNTITYKTDISHKPAKRNTVFPFQIKRDQNCWGKNMPPVRPRWDDWFKTGWRWKRWDGGIRAIEKDHPRFQFLPNRPIFRVRSCELFRRTTGNGENSGKSFCLGNTRCVFYKMVLRGGCSGWDFLLFNYPTVWLDKKKFISAFIIFIFVFEKFVRTRCFSIVLSFLSYGVFNMYKKIEI